MASVNARTALEIKGGRRHLEAGNSFKTICRLWFTATTNGRMSDLALLS